MDPTNSVPTSPKQQVAERIRQATNVLVTVRTNPTVDELASVIGLTLMLNKLGKHATAVFSGVIPSTIEFLKPEETIETNTDSLRDFIVSLDKSKADKLRYKVEENVVKIFITPYRTSISEKDLEFSQGDFNVDVVLALGVTQREELDTAIIAHGRILHDATVVTVTAGQRESTLGTINWQEPAASSLSEMLVSISEALQGNLIDAQMATAFLTGIVSETERFSNTKTTPKVMTMSAQLMAAGANQQLIANELQKVDESVPMPPQPVVPVVDSTPAESKDGALMIEHQSEEPVLQPEAPIAPPEPLPEPAPSSEEIAAILEQPAADLPEIEIPMPEVVPSEVEKVDVQPLPEVPTLEVPPELLTPTESGTFLPPPIPPVEMESYQALDPDADMNASQIHIDEDGNMQLPVEPAATRRKVIQPPDHAGEPEPQSTVPAASVLPPAGFEIPDQSQPSPDILPGLEPADQPILAGGDTLLDIEKSVHSPHVAGETHEDVDSARNAVTNAINQSPYDPSRPDPRNDINAQPLGDILAPLPLPDQPQAPNLDEQSHDLPEPPSVPPPMMPQQ